MDDSLKKNIEIYDLNSITKLKPDFWGTQYSNIEEFTEKFPEEIELKDLMEAQIYNTELQAIRRESSCKLVGKLPFKVQKDASALLTCEFPGHRIQCHNNSSRYPTLDNSSRLKSPKPTLEFQQSLFIPAKEARAQFPYQNHNVHNQAHGEDAQEIKSKVTNSENNSNSFILDRDSKAPVLKGL